MRSSAAQRPLSDLPSDYFGVFFWFDPANGITVVMDITFINSTFGFGLPTTMSGSIHERSLPDGTAEETLVAHVADAFTFAWDSSGNLVFGNDMFAVLSGAEPALGDYNVVMKFINPNGPGLPIDVGEVLFMSFSGRAAGLIQPSGDSGALEVRQTGLPSTALKANPHSEVALDAFPAEHIRIRALP